MSIIPLLAVTIDVVYRSVCILTECIVFLVILATRICYPAARQQATRDVVTSSSVRRPTYVCVTTFTKDHTLVQ